MLPKFHLIFLLSFYLSGAFAQNIEPAIVSGKITDFVEVEDNLFVKVMYKDIATREFEEILGTVEPDGRFRIEVPLPYSQDVYLTYPEQMITLLLTPGEHLQLHFSEVDFRSKEPSGSNAHSNDDAIPGMAKII